MLRLLVVASGVLGGAGVALLAAAAHVGGDNLHTAASFMLFHAPALLAIGLAGRGRALAIAGCALLVGVSLFAGDLILRGFAGERLFAMAAPAGGLLTIFGWLGVAFSGLCRHAKARRDLPDSLHAL